MRLIRQIEVLRGKIDLIDKLDLYSEVDVVDLVECAFWARSILEIIKKVKFENYNYTLALRINQIYTNNGLPISGPIVQPKGFIELQNLLGTIVHHRSIGFGNTFLQVQSDKKKKLCQVYFSDFVEALKSLLIPKKLLAVAVCDLAEEPEMFDLGGKGWHEQLDFFCTDNLSWLIGDFLTEEVEIKGIVVKKFFGISDISTEMLRKRNLSWGVGSQTIRLLYIERYPAKPTQSERFSLDVLTDLIRQFCLNNKDW